MNRFFSTFVSATVFLAVFVFSATGEPLGNYLSEAALGRSIIITTSSTGQKIRITPYGPDMVRVQAIVSGKPFLPILETSLSSPIPGRVRWFL